MSPRIRIPNKGWDEAIASLNQMADLLAVQKSATYNAWASLDGRVQTQSGLGGRVFDSQQRAARLQSTATNLSGQLRSVPNVFQTIDGRFRVPLPKGTARARLPFEMTREQRARAEAVAQVDELIGQFNSLFAPAVKKKEKSGWKRAGHLAVRAAKLSAKTGADFTRISAAGGLLGPGWQGVSATLAPNDVKSVQKGTMRAVIKFPGRKFDDLRGSAELAAKIGQAYVLTRASNPEQLERNRKMIGLVARSAVTGLIAINTDPVGTVGPFVRQAGRKAEQFAHADLDEKSEILVTFALDEIFDALVEKGSGKVLKVIEGPASVASADGVRSVSKPSGKPSIRRATDQPGGGAPATLPSQRRTGHPESGAWEEGGQGMLFPPSEFRSPDSPGIAHATPGRPSPGSVTSGTGFGSELGQGQLFNPASTFGRTEDLDAYLGSTFGGFDRYVESVSRNVLGTNVGVAPDSLISRHGDASISAVVSTIPPYSRSSFGVGPTIHAGARWDWIDDSGVRHNVKMHSIDFANHQGLILDGANTRAGYTMQYQVGNRFLTTSGDLIRKPNRPKMPAVVWDYLTSIRKAEAGSAQTGALKPPTVDGRTLTVQELTIYQDQFDAYNAKMESIHIPVRE
ncbi:MAG: hypothetical protein KF883_04765 [Thermomicrobiales bacterium]|nr:hypothetical protein [Thermomicrobiales bacterium]